MKKTAIALGILGALAATPVLAASPFAGPYVGGNLQYQNDSSRLNSTVGTSGQQSATGAGVGLEAGYGWRNGPNYLGVEADGTLSTTHGSVDSALGTTKYENHQQASLAVEPGVVIGNDQALLYGRAGWAVADGKISSTNYPAGDRTLNGPLLGVGVAVPVAQNVDAKLGYDHTWFEKETLGGSQITPSEDAIRAGVDFHF